MKINSHYLKKIALWLYPYVCILCKQPSNQNRDLCKQCQQELPLLKHFCLKCAAPLTTCNNEMICGICLHHSQPFNIAYALYLYQAPITKLILSLKFSRSLVNAHVLGGLLAEMIKTTWYKDKPFPSIIIPVPLHPKRLKERGFNQALELARPISRLLKIPIDALSCKRIKHTAAQATLSSIERQKNVKNSFKILKQFTTQHIAVLDDVITTGHTIREFCDALKRHGAKTIDVWCCARPK